MTSASLLLSVPLLYLLTALCLGLPEARATSRFTLAQRWWMARVAAHLAPVLAAAAGLAHLAGRGDGVTGGLLDADAGWASHPLGWMVPSLSVRSDALTLIMLALVTSVALVITRYSGRYLDGEPGQLRYLRAFALTMAAVCALVVSNHLLVVTAAWSVSSIALHQLLTFYRDRPQALVAAHKKFLMSRVADFSLFGAVALLHHHFGTLEMDALVQRARALSEVPATLELAGALLAFGVILRSAQLPFHGWLIQVMEAPTPVSALLHAGIVNIGGFVLIRLAGLLGQLHVAPTLLVVVGALTATLAGLVMTTRVSVKVGLAWSTCAQMGFMLVECGLGASELALLHLVAHSLYKAHAFLASGRTVAWVVEGGARRAAGPSLGRSLAALGLTLPAVFGLDALVGGSLGASVPGWAGGFIAALALTPVVSRIQPRQAPRTAAVVLGGACLAILAYSGLHAAFALVVEDTSLGGTEGPALARLALVVVLFAASFGVHATLQAAPTGALARRLYPAAFAGLYLDEVFTRLTFALWPPRALAGAREPSNVAQTSSIGSVA